MMRPRFDRELLGNLIRALDRDSTAMHFRTCGAAIKPGECRRPECADAVSLLIVATVRLGELEQLARRAADMKRARGKRPGGKAVLS